jgi:GT2 family glycosyltransferase
MTGLRGLLARLSSGGRASRAAAALLVEADRARLEGRWSEAAEAYAHHAKLRPRRVGTRIQLGNMLKEAGDRAGAEAAYQAALALRPTVEAWSQLGYLFLTSGRTVEAAGAFESALALVAGFAPARDGLVAAGRRERLSRVDLDPEALGRLRGVADELPRAIDRLADAAIAPLALYDAFRKRNPVAAPPAKPDLAVRVLVDGRGAAPYRVRATLLSLIEQDFGSWTTVVLTDDALSSHPVAALAAIDSRIRFGPDADAEEAGATVLVDAGVVLDPHALAWLAFAARRTGADVVYADHDHLAHAASGVVYRDPAFQPAPDPDDLATTPAPPVLTFWRERASTDAGVRNIRAALADAAAQGRAAHLPVILCSVLDLPVSAASGLPSPQEPEQDYLRPAAIPTIDLALADEGEALRIIIPTRDEQALLAACLDSLRSTAARPDRLRITVVDNGSRTREMADYLRRETAAGRLSVLAVDEPFNWSRLNNLAVATTVESHLLLLNNDTEMITPGWDVRLSGQLARQDIGVVGARLLYPDGGLQHGGVVFGLATGTPRHEGVGVGGTGDDAGPLARWRRTRSVAAVTGAFMGLRRQVFEQVGGFDEARLAVAYNDIDFCLRCRDVGLRILFEGEIELTHHESRSRGLNDTRGRMAWDAGEWASLHQRWGPALASDPAVNPHWSTPSLRPFDGLRAVSAQEAIYWLDRSVTDPWKPQDRSAGTG